MRRRFIDIGANLTDPQFRGIYRNSQKHIDDFDAVISRAKQAHVSQILVTGSNLKESEAAFDLCQKYPHYLFSTVGVHPCHAADVPTDPIERQIYFENLENLAKIGAEKGIVKAFGEIGLDYDRLHYAPADTQRQIFEIQLKLASRLGLPLFLHSRNASVDFHRMIKPYTLKLEGVVHSFTGTSEELQDLLSLGLYIGVNGCSLKTEENLAVAQQIPLNRLLLETDGPWCEIRPTHASYKYINPLPWDAAKKPEKWSMGHMVRGRCEPCTIGSVSQVLAALHKVPEQEVVDAALENTIKLFKFEP